MNDYAIYLRKSRADLEAEARGEGETLSRHRTALHALAERRGFRVVREYSELVTGDSIAARPQMQALLDDVKRGLYSGVIVNDVDRLGRGDSIDQEIIKLTFAASHTLIITPLRDIDPASPSDEDMLDFSMFFARFEYRKIAQRLMQGRIRSAESGNYINSRIPIGYKQVKDGRRVTLEPDPETAPIVQMIFDMYGNRGVGKNGICRALCEMGIKSNRGYWFAPGTIMHILSNPVYIGTVKWGQTKTVATVENGRKVKRSVTTDGAIVVENAHPAIIDRALFDKVQAIMHERHIQPRNNINKPLSNPLAGIVHCAVCGRIMRAQHSKRGYQLICPNYGCSTVGAPIYVVESALLETLQGWCAEYSEAPDAPEPHTDNTPALQRQLSTLEVRLAKARELVELGIYSPAEYSDQKTMLTRQIDSIKREMAEQAAPPVANAIHSIVPEIKTVLDAYPLAETPAEKNALLKTIVQKVEFEKFVKGTRTSGPGQHLKLIVYPRLVL